MESVRSISCKKIEHQPDWKDRKHDTTYTSLVEYKGQKAFVGVTVLKDSNNKRYYLSKGVDHYGDAIFAANTTASPSASDGTSALAGDLDTVAKDKAGAGNNVPITSIPSHSTDVNTRTAPGILGV